MSRVKAIKWSAIALAVVFVALIISSCGLAMIANNRYLHQMETALAAIPPPPQSEHLATRSAVGVLAGNGNHCDFFVGTLFRSDSDSTPEAIGKHYAGRTFLNPMTGTNEEIDVTILTNRE